MTNSPPHPEPAHNGSSAPPPCPSLADLAAYLDGLTTPSEQDAIDIHLTQCSDCLITIQEIRQMHHEWDEATPFVPPTVIEAAQNLIQSPTLPVSESRSYAFQLWISPGRRILAAAATIAICLVGYRLGLHSIQFSEISQVSNTSDDLLEEMSFGVLSSSESLSSDLYALSFSENSP